MARQWTLITALRHLMILVLLGLGAAYLYLRFLTVFFHSKDFYEPHHRQGTSQLTLEGFDIHSAYADEITKWTIEQYAASPPPLKNKIAIVTGATKGLGRGIAGHLAALGAKLVLPCRRCDPEQLKRTVKKDAVAYAVKYGKVPQTKADKLQVAEPYVFDVDLADLDQIDAMIAKYQEQQIPPADLLINNAGLVSMFPSKTKQGFESTFAVNFLAAAYLTEKLIEKDLVKGKILSISSEEHRSGDTIKEKIERTGKPFGGFFGEGIADALDRYSYTKLLETTYFLTLARKHPSLKVIDMCPGPIASDIAMSVVWPLNVIVTTILDWVFPANHKVAIPVIRLAIGKQFENVTGEHFHIAEKRLTRGDTRDVKIQDWLYEQTKELIRKRTAPA